MPDRVSEASGNLRPLRKQAMMTQEELAAKAGVGIRTIRDIELGKVRPQPRTLRLLFEALGLTEADRATLTAPTDLTATVPRELPRTLAGFAGREPQLNALLAAVDSGVAAVVVHGMAGVGKTSLAVRAAHALAPRYPDGQLFVDLHGFTHAAGPRPDLKTLLTRVLRSLDVSGQKLPSDLDELTARYRSALAGRRVLMVLDNAASAEQVEALLPGMPDSLIVATSRRDLSALAGAYSVALEPLSQREAVAMIGAATDGRVTAAEAVAVAERCGRLPLAMGLAAARLRSRPLWQASDLLERLADEDRLLDELDMGHRGVAAALRASYRELDAAQQRLLRRLSLVPGDEVNAHAAAALCEVGAERASAMLESLVDVHLAESRSSGRYRLHDLVRLFAARLAGLEEARGDRDAAFVRLLGVYLHCAYQAAARLHPNKRRFADGAAAHDAGLPGFADQPGALSWFQSERGNLEAAVTAADQAGRLDEAWHLATAFNAFFVHDSDIGAHATVNRIALDIARRTGDGRKEAFTLGDAGRQLLAVGRHREAIRCLERSVALKRDLGEIGDAALTLANIGILHRRWGRFAESVEVHEAALIQAEQAADAAAAALIRTNMVVPLLRLGRFAEVERCLDAAERRLDSGDDHNRIRIEAFRGVLLRERGDAARAVAVHTACLQGYRGEGVTADVTATLIELGEDLLLLGRGAEAAAHFSRAVEYAVKLADPSLERSARNGLGRAHLALGDIEPATAQLELAASLAESHEDTYERARAQRGLAEVHRLKGDTAAARRYLRLAAEGFAYCGVPEAAATAATERREPGTA
ncbi:helix-turn-helix domain-containing protein [Glycomyces sp. TRM65418]|uniref:ATP-binding protein n=1 Tax=Glycomyces sp. TRM65418 TaxID=2867006 RepID=UPI001CE6B5C0|nr:helix-turn-helix domain-containing protein [Glycomyces sp. TRM65418]MCC3761513.1 helix-turn-helix domain-containing protein [Glycomyces sp. TRM65418]QZD55611.1 helix-turn-helix domain-containing protein [Glycomyces sp. TRM65418]